MSDYSQINDYSAKDALATGNPLKIIAGSDIDSELDAISTAIASKFDSTSIASAGEAQAGILNTVVMTPGRTTSWAQNAAGVVEDIQALTDPGDDRILFWDFSALDTTWLSLGAGLAISGTELAIDTAAGGAASADRTLTAGNGLSGGGDLTADRTFDLDFDELAAATVAAADLLAVADVSDSNTVKKATLTELLAGAGGDFTAGTGLQFSTGTGVLGVATTIATDLSSLTEETNVDFAADAIAFHDTSEAADRKITPDDLFGAALGDAAYYRSASLTVSSNTDLAFDTSVYDELQRGTVASGEYTRGSVAGRVAVHAQMTIASMNDDQEFSIAIRKNGTIVAKHVIWNDSDNDTPQMSISVSQFVSCSASDVIDVVGSATSGAGEALTTGAAYTYVTYQELS